MLYNVCFCSVMRINIQRAKRSERNLKNWETKKLLYLWGYKIGWYK